MNVLLDTHIALWAITDSPRLPKQAFELISNPKNTIWVSVATIWEIAIKFALGRGDMPVSCQDALHYFQQSGYKILAIEAEHVIAAGALPIHHQDPFDRVLIGQALTEPMRLMTHDRLVAKYSNTIILV